MSFVDAEIVVDPNQLVNDALDQFNAQLEAIGAPGWDAADANAFVILINTIAQMAADLGTTASTVLPAIFRAFGTQLVGIPYLYGTYAMVVTTWTFTNPAPVGGYLIAAGTAVIIDGQAFYVTADVPVTAGATSATITLQAAEVGTSYNGLGGVGDGYPDVQLNDQIDWVANVTTASATSGGTDQQDDQAYEDDLAAELSQRVAAPVVATDFPTYVKLNTVVNATGVAVGRATAISGYYPGVSTAADGARTSPTPLTFVGSLTSGSPTVSITSPPFYGAIPDTGATVTGTGVPTSTTVLSSPTPTTTAFTMSANATAPETDETITVGAWQNVKGALTVFVTDANGNPFTNAQMDALQAYLQARVLQNTLVYVEPPSYNAVYVTAQVHVLPDYFGNEAAVEAAVSDALVSYLNPGTWGSTPTQGGNGGTWYNATSGFGVVRFNSLIAVIEQVPGVQYVVNGTLKIGFSATPTATADLTLGGPAPLPTTDATKLVISADN